MVTNSNHILAIAVIRLYLHSNRYCQYLYRYRYRYIMHGHLYSHETYPLIKMRSRTAGQIPYARE